MKNKGTPNKVVRAGQSRQPEQSTATGADYRDGVVTRLVVSRVEEIQLSSAAGFAFQLLDTLPLSIFVKDRLRRFTYLNAKARDMMAFGEKRVIGVPDRDALADKQHVDLYRRFDGEVMESKEPRYVKEPWINEHGEYIVHRTTRYPILLRSSGGEEIAGVASIAEDISFRQKSEAAHAIASLLTHDWLTDSVLPYLVECLRQSREDAVNALLPAFQFLVEYFNALGWLFAERSQLKEGATPVRILSDIIDPMVDVFEILEGRRAPIDSKIEIEAKRDIFTLDISSDWLFARAHRVMLKIIVLQQYRNHVNHGFSAEPLKVKGLPDEEGAYILSFHSRGARVSDEVEPVLGDKFVRRSDRPGKPGEATGLHFCKRIAEMHGGDFSYAYDESSGCNVFSYRLFSIPEDEG